MSTEAVVAKISPPYSERHALALENACIEFGIEKELEKVHFLGQCAHETGEFRRARESMNYTPGSLRATFGNRITPEQAMRLGRADGNPAQQEAIANLVYGGDWGRRRLGNTRPGDGWAFRGGGDIQLTGRDNYARCSRALFGDDRLERDPDMIADPVVAARAAGWFWRSNWLKEWALRDDTKAVSRAINLGDPQHRGTPNGLAHRVEMTERVRRLFRELRGSRPRS